MKKVLLTFILLEILSLFTSKLSAVAASVGTATEENKFGIHILEPSDLLKASELVNSEGGDWGYVTIVIREDDLNTDKWQGFMDSCREKHLIPLVRIATHLEGANWAKPKIDEAKKWSDFLGNLNWPTKNQYLIIFNEPNHDKEWGGQANAKEYAQILNTFIQNLRLKDSRFKILNAGFDLAAGNSSGTLEISRFWQEMNWEIPGIFEQLDGWSSHSYPNHGYLGRPWDSGRTSIKGYEWEIWYLKNRLGVKKELPVFITETGWPAEDKIQYKEVWVNRKKKLVKISNYYDRETVANYLKYAFENLWLKDNRLKAITPFLLNYQEPLFASFSWLTKEGTGYPQYQAIKALLKNSWWPEQEINFEVESVSLPPFMPTNSVYEGSVVLKNSGQAILGEKEIFVLKSIADKNLKISDLILPENEKIKPGEKFTFGYLIKTTTASGSLDFGWEDSIKYKIKVIPSSIISNARFGLWQKFSLTIKRLLGRN